MQFYKFFVFVAIFVACVLAVQGYPRQFQQPQQLAELPDEAAGAAGPAAQSNDHNRQKKFAIVSSYSALPAYTAFPYSSYAYPYVSAASYPSFYSSPYFI